MARLSIMSNDHRGKRIACVGSVTSAKRTSVRSVGVIATALLACGMGLAQDRPARAAPTTPAAKPADGLRFDILAFNIAGNSALAIEQIEAAVYPFLGPGKLLADVEGARAALEKAYQDGGFLSVVVSIPQQRVRGGDILLEVTEAPVDKLRITGARYHLPSALRDDAPSVAPGAVPNFNDLQFDLARMQASPDVQVTPLVTAADEPGKIAIDLKVQDSLPLHGSAELNNKQSYNTEGGRLEAGLRYDNLFQREQSLGLNWVYSPRRPGQANTLVLNYALPVRSDVHDRADNRFSVLTVLSDSNTPSSLGGVTVVKGTTLGLRYRMPLSARTDGAANAWSLGLDHKRNRDANQDVGGFTTTNPDLRYSVLVFGYDFSFSGAEGRLATGDATLTVGARGLGQRTVDCNGTPRDQFDCKRVGASPAFNTLKLGASWRGPLFSNWSASVRLQSQLSSQSLVSGEQFGAGGTDSVRGYYDFEQVGDLGLSSQIELASPNWTPMASLTMSGLLFLDRAWLRALDALPSEQSNVRMGSYGIGLRAQGSGGLQVRIDFAIPQFATLKADSSGKLVPASGSATPNPRRWELSVRQVF
jgi:hemolysin activation/secretion protein